MQYPDFVILCPRWEYLQSHVTRIFKVKASQCLFAAAGFACVFQTLPNHLQRKQYRKRANRRVLKAADWVSQTGKSVFSALPARKPSGGNTDSSTVLTFFQSPVLGFNLKPRHDIVNRSLYRGVRPSEYWFLSL